MKKILGIIGSPRKLGNSEIMIKEISRHITVPHQLNLIRLSDFNILPCRGCYQCLFKEERCILDDELPTVLNAIIEADALIVATPTYFLSANSSLKRLIDRGLAFYAHGEALWGKPALGIGVAGIDGKEGYTLLGIESFLLSILAENKKSVMIYGALPGEIFLNAKNKQMAVTLASALFEPPSEKDGPSCPLCGGQTFRFLGDNRIRCMLCSNSGSIRMETERPEFTIHKSDHDFFLSKENAQKHKEWLLGMKGRFIEEKSKLKEISFPYLNEGNWIKP